QTSTLPASATGSPVAIGAPGTPTTAPASAPASTAGTVATSVPTSPPPAGGPARVRSRVHGHEYRRRPRLGWTDGDLRPRRRTDGFCRNSAQKGLGCSGFGYPRR